MEFYPDDNLTRIYYEHPYDDLVGACFSNNKIRVEWIWNQGLVDQGDIWNAYLECLIKRNYEMTDFLDALTHISVKSKLYAMQLIFERLFEN